MKLTTTKEKLNHDLEKVTIKFQTKLDADRFEEWCRTYVERNNKTERIDEYRVKACRGLQWHFSNYYLAMEAKKTW